MNLYTDVQTKLPITIILLTKTDKTSDALSIVSISFQSRYLYILQACTSSKDHLEGPSRVQQFLESFRNFAFLRTDGAGTLPSPCSKLLVQYFAFEQLPIHFFSISWRNVTKRRVLSLFLSVIFSDE